MTIMVYHQDKPRLMGWLWWLQTDEFFQVKWDDDPQWLSCFSGLKASCRVFSKFPSIFTNFNEYDHSRARECLGLAIGFLMNYDELWWSLEFKSHCSFPYRRTARRLRWKECGPGAWDSEQWLSPHRITSTYRHIDMACLKPQSTKWKKLLFKNVKTIIQRNCSALIYFWICFVRLFYCRRFPEMLYFFRLLKQLIFYITSFLCQELSYMIYDVISFQTCSSSETFTFDVMKSFQICPFKEPSYLMRFLFSNFPFQELSHLMWSLFRFIPFQERSYLMWFLFRNCPFQELSHVMLNLFRFVPFQEESHFTWFSFPFK